MGQDKKADLSIHTYVDDVMRGLMSRLQLDIPEYDPSKDPVKQTKDRNFPNELFHNWTQDGEKARELKKLGDAIHEQYLQRRREDKKRKNAYIDNDSDLKTNKLQKKIKDEDEFISDLKEETPFVE